MTLNWRVKLLAAVIICVVITAHVISGPWPGDFDNPTEAQEIEIEIEEIRKDLEAEGTEEAKNILKDELSSAGFKLQRLNRQPAVLD